MFLLVPVGVLVDVQRVLGVAVREGVVVDVAVVVGELLLSLLVCWSASLTVILLVYALVWALMTVLVCG